MIHDRWISKYTWPLAATLSQLKTTLEGEAEVAPEHRYEVYVQTVPDRLWQAIIDPDLTRQYFADVTFESTWEPGAPYQALLPDGVTLFEGIVLKVDPPHQLVYSFHYVGDEGARHEHPSRVTWKIVAYGETCQLTLVHNEFMVGEIATFREVGESWPFTLSSLKTLLETGQPLSLHPSP